jgi:hypothetical protein
MAAEAQNGTPLSLGRCGQLWPGAPVSIAEERPSLSLSDEAAMVRPVQTGCQQN